MVMIVIHEHGEEGRYLAVWGGLAGELLRKLQYFLEKWQSRYSSSTDATKTKVFFPCVDGKKIKRLALAKEKRNNLYILVQAGTGCGRPHLPLDKNTK